MKKLPVRNTEALRLFLRLKGVGVFTIDLAFILLPEIWHRAPGAGQPNPVQYSANISWQRRLWKLPPLPAPALRGQGRWNSGYEGWKHWLWSLQCTCGSSPLCSIFGMKTERLVVEDKQEWLKDQSFLGVLSLLICLKFFGKAQAVHQLNVLGNIWLWR